MKRIIITLGITFASLASALGQSNADSVMRAISADYQKQRTLYRQHYDAKEFDRTVEVLKKTIAMLENIPLSQSELAKEQSGINGAKCSLYYDLACSESLLGRKREAVEAFAKSVDLGYKNYRHALTDTDLDNIRRQKRFVVLMEKLRHFDTLVVLKKSGGYEAGSRDSLPEFTYQHSGDYRLRAVREYFRLDTLGGADEIEQIKRLLLFATDIVKWDGSNWALCEFDGIDFYNYHKTTGKGVNCRHKAMMLNEMYLAMGFTSRYVTCMPEWQDDTDCHVINCVWSQTLAKWLWMDPSWGIWVTDDEGSLLGIAEVRERLREGKPLALNSEARETKEHYLENYMAKNLYWFTCSNVSRFNTESRYRSRPADLKYISLIPLGFDRTNSNLQGDTTTHDSDYFWQAPVGAGE